MKRICQALFALSVLFISCDKNKDNDNPPANNRDWFKLKTLTYTAAYDNGNKFYSRDSTDITIDSVNNKLVFKNYISRNVSGNPIWSDSAIETYSYDDENKLALYEKVSNYDRLYISRMDFVRDAGGRLVKVLSAYKNSLIPSSEGTVKYDKHGDTTFVTYTDSSVKHPDRYADARDCYQAGLVNDRVVYYKDYLVMPGTRDSSQTRYEYDAGGNLTSETYQYNKSIVLITSYQPGSETPKELQKFLSQWAGDLLWFRRYKLFDFMNYFETVNTYTGNVRLSKKQNSTAPRTYTNAFDANGNLSSVVWQAYAGSALGTMTYTEKNHYRP